MLTHIFVGRDKSLKAVEAAIEANDELLVIAQRDPEVAAPRARDLYRVGVLAEVGRTWRLPDGATSVLLRGRRRARVVRFARSTPYLQASAELLTDEHEPGLAIEALRRAVLALFEKCVELSPDLSHESLVAAMNADHPGELADLIATSLSLSVPEKQGVLETLDCESRLQRVSVIMGRELDVLELQSRIQTAVQGEVDRTQREFYLREQMRAIREELGQTDPTLREMETLRQQIEEAGMPAAVAEKSQRELQRLADMPPMAPEVAVIRNYLDWLLELPWSKQTADNLDVRNAAKVLESEHYGLQRAKERVLEHIAVRQLASDSMRIPILCFVGPPGTGKTSLGRSMANALGRVFVRVSLGGVRDEAEIRGHRRTYVGALPGRILQTMRRAGTVNPLFMLDEIDKLGTDFRGDPAAALLEVLDPEQNCAFSDHYLDEDYDLSKVFFITTANHLDPVPPALLDRMEVIEFPGYIEEEKLEIARRFLIPRQLREHGLSDVGLRFSDAVLRRMVREYTHEAGVRNLERQIASVCRKIARRKAEGRSTPEHITVGSLQRYLGPPQYTYGIAEESDEVGVATGVSVTDAGGDLMSVEVTLMPGKGQLQLTGQLGDVMQESAHAALSYARSNAQRLGIDPKEFERLDIHVHVPEGAVPKDGPSAGITIATAMISALSQQRVRRHVAMTGEITLRGRVLPIGGLKEKVLAAHRAGLTTVLLPGRNKKDLSEIPMRVRREIELVLVDRMDQVLPVALIRDKRASPSRATR
jgi:ATP-dependent Lon protease